MAEFKNTIDIFGDDIVARTIVNKSVVEYNDDSIVIIRQYAFYGCSKLTSAVLPSATSIGDDAFRSCSNLTSINLPSATSIRNSAFQSCSNLTSMILRNSTVCALSSTTTFNNTPFASGKAGGKLLVPRDLVETYKTATNWSVIWGYGHNQLLALEDYTVDGTTTGEIDWDKLNGGTTA